MSDDLKIAATLLGIPCLFFLGMMYLLVHGSKKTASESPVEQKECVDCFIAKRQRRVSSVLPYNPGPREASDGQQCCPSPPQFTSLAGPTEAEECRRLAPKYKVPETGIEYRLWDGTRVDLLSDEYAIEADWAATGKHFEAIGQALYYALVTGRKPGIILLVKDRERDAKYVYRTQAVCAKYGITLFVEDSE